MSFMGVLNTVVPNFQQIGMRYLSGSGGSSSNNASIYGIAGGVAGSYYGGPAGGMAGAQIGSQIGGALGKNAAAQSLSRGNRKWQEYMSNTAHQREVADLRAAGLNPILSATHTGATTPSGNVAPVENAFKGVDSSSAFQIMKIIAEANKTNAETNLITTLGPQKMASEIDANFSAGKASYSSSVLTAENAKLVEKENEVKREMLQTQLDIMKNENLSIQLKNAILGQDFFVAKAAAIAARREGAIDETEYGNAMRYINRLIPGAKAATSTAAQGRFIMRGAGSGSNRPANFGPTYNYFGNP